MHRNDNNNAIRLMLDLKGDTMWADWIDVPTMTSEELATTYAGTYYCNALDIAYNLVVNDGRLTIRHRRYADRPLQATGEDEFLGGIGIVRFSRNEQGGIGSFSVTDEDTNFKPLIFRKIGSK